MLEKLFFINVPAFSQVILADPKLRNSHIELEVGRVTIKISATTPADHLASVIQSLA